MITYLLISLLYILSTLLLAPFPNVPAMPSAIADPLNWLSGFIGSGIGTVMFILSPPIFTAMVFVGVALISFDFLWASFWFILRKVPFVSYHVRQ